MLRFIKENLFMIVFMVSAAVTLIVSTITLNSMSSTIDNMNSARENLNETSHVLSSNYERRLHATVAAAKPLLSYDELEGLLGVPGSPTTHEAWFSDTNFQRMRARMVSFADEYELVYVYFFTRIDEYIQPLIDNDPDLVEAYTPSDDLKKIDSAAREAWNERKTVVLGTGSGGLLVDQDGLMSAYAPVFDPLDGEVIAIVGVDIKDEQLYILSDQIESLSSHTEELSNRMSYLFVGMIAALALLVSGGVLNFMANRKRTEALKDALSVAENASRAKSDFLANMSHEMRTPLNAVIGMTKIARDSDDQERKEYCLVKISEASTHLLGVINDVLDYSKIEASKFDLLETEFNFAEMIEMVSDVIGFKVAEKKLEFSREIDPKIPVMLLGDEQHVAQVIANFLSNAVKFTPEGGKVILRAMQIGETDGHPIICVEVTDTGIGISDEQKSRLFKSFEQADNTITKKFGGTGLGLAISKRIVEMMGGEVTLESKPGEGSTFGFKALFKKAAVQPDERVSVAPKIEDKGDVDDNELDLTGLRLLLVDDVEINREIVLALLESTSIEIDIAVNGREALDKFSENPEAYNIVLMDVQMPEMDGYEATRRIRALETPHAGAVPILAMTANAFRDDIEKAMAAGMNAHIAKPIDFDDMMRKLREYLKL